MSTPRRVFLDSNIIISAALNERSRFQMFWRIPDTEILLSQFVLDECSRNLLQPAQRARLWQLVYQSHIVPDGREIVLPGHVRLPAKDIPVLQGAVAGSADSLVTGDLSHFTPLFGSTIMGVLVEETAVFKARYPHVFHPARS